MEKITRSIKFLAFFYALLISGEVLSQATFVPNQGQWEEDFFYKTRLNTGAVFFEKNGYSIVLNDPEFIGHAHHEAEKHERHDENAIVKVAYRMRWIDASTSSDQVSGFSKEPYYHNYFLGKDQSRWKPHVPVFKGITYRQLYPGITVNYYEDEDKLKYDLHLAPNADISKLAMEYEGLDDLRIEEGQLVMQTALGNVVEYIPEAYQVIKGEKVTVDCKYELKDGKVRFRLGTYDKSQGLIIDPVLNFATFSGSSSDNWGYTATYGNNGEFYGGGIVEGNGYPVTTGSFQNSFGGKKFDASISKFSSDGKNLLYATYLGGNSIDMPHSMIVNQQDELIILGSTGSTDFPTLSNSYQDTLASGASVGYTPWQTQYDNGANAFVVKFNASGSSLQGATLLGSNQGATGTNTKIVQNYCDNSRGEVIVLNNGDIAIATSTLAGDFNFLNPGNINRNNAKQDAVIAVFNSSLTQLEWGSFFGGSEDETGYSLKTNGTDLYLCGATASSDLPTHTSSFNPNYGGSGHYDGYIAKFNGSNGTFLGATYVGTAEDDQVFFIDFDKFGNVLALGLSKGTMPVSTGKYSNPGSKQFIQKYDRDLSSLMWSTVVGSGGPKVDLVPTAFNIDDCLDIFISGWNGAANDRINVPNNGFYGDTRGLPTSPDAIDSTTDGSDFYFMVLERDAGGFLFGSYYGGGVAREHVDGGTSRFSPDGVIYQAVCAGCGREAFPTTPGVYSPNNQSQNCNLGAIKITFDKSVRAKPQIDYQSLDTTCDRLTVQLINNSVSADSYWWDLGNGQTSTDFQPITTYEGLGVYTITLIATDTVCDISDTAQIQIDNDKVNKPKALMEADYAGCDGNYFVEFKNISPKTNIFNWDFGDGNTSTEENPTHTFPDSGTYTVTLIARDSACPYSDTITKKISFQDTSVLPLTYIEYEVCERGEMGVVHEVTRKRFEYFWEFDGRKAKGQYPLIKFSEPGNYMIKLEIEDPLCNRQYQEQYNVKIEDIPSEVFIPNAFSPNGDGINEEFVLSGDQCNPNDYFRIFNRWGEIVFETQHPFSEFWDGMQNGKPAKEDVYTYILKSGTDIDRGYLTLFR